MLTKADMGDQLFDIVYNGNVYNSEARVFNTKKIKEHTLQNIDGTDHYRIITEDGEILLSEDMVVFGACDTAKSISDIANYTVLQVWAYNRPNKTLYLLKQFRERMLSPDIVELFKDTHIEFPQLSFIGVEGKEVFEFAKKEKLRVRELVTKGDKKLFRARSASAMMNKGYISIPKDMQGKDYFYFECSRFPNVTNDDVVDALSYACILAPELSEEVYIPNVQKLMEQVDAKRKKTGIKPPVQRKFYNIHTDIPLQLPFS